MRYALILICFLFIGASPADAAWPPTKRAPPEERQKQRQMERGREAKGDPGHNVRVGNRVISFNITVVTDSSTTSDRINLASNRGCGQVISTGWHARLGGPPVPHKGISPPRNFRRRPFHIY